VAGRAHPGGGGAAHRLEVEITKIKTTGDMILDVPLSKVGGKGLFVKEIEEALLENRIDLGGALDEGRAHGAPPGARDRLHHPAEDPRDAFLSGMYQSLEELPKGAKLGRARCGGRPSSWGCGRTFPSVRSGGTSTRASGRWKKGSTTRSSSRRGLRRLGWEGKIRQYLPEDLSIPAIGQGALGIEIRGADARTREAVAFLNDRDTSVAVRAERGFLKRLEGGCQVPVAAHGTIAGAPSPWWGWSGVPTGRRSCGAAAAGPSATRRRSGWPSRRSCFPGREKDPRRGVPAVRAVRG